VTVLVAVGFICCQVTHDCRHFEHKFQMEGSVATNHCWCQKTRVIAVSCGIKISAVHCLVLLQSKRVTDRQTNRIMTSKTALK